MEVSIHVEAASSVAVTCKGHIWTKPVLEVSFFRPAQSTQQTRQNDPERRYCDVDVQPGVDALGSGGVELLFMELVLYKALQ